MTEFTWDVQIAGEDLPRRLQTDYLLAEGDEIDVDGSLWIVHSVLIDEDIADATGIVTVGHPSEP